MNDAPSTPEVKPKKDRKLKPAAAIRGKLDLMLFRGLLERIAARPENFSDEHIRFVQELLQSLANDANGLVRVTFSPSQSQALIAKPRFSASALKVEDFFGDDEVHTTTRELALLRDDQSTFERIDGLSAGFLHKAAALFGFKSDTIVGLKAGFAEVVSDVRQMENIAAARPRQSDEQISVVTEIDALGKNSI